MRSINKKGQNAAEYAILIALVIAAAIGIQTYVKRGFQGRLKDESDRIVQSAQGIFGNDDQSAAWDTIGTVEVNASQQFEPKDFSREMHSNTMQDYTGFSMATGGTANQEFYRQTKPAAENDTQGYGYTKEP